MYKSTSRPIQWLAQLCLVLCCVTRCQLAPAATVDPDEFQSLTRQAQARGATRVLVNLAPPVTLQTLASNPAAVKADMKQRSDALLAELGSSALSGGYWTNDAGQVGVFMTPQGLRQLASSRNAVSFTADPTEKMRSRIQEADGRGAAIEAAIERDGTATVEIALNLDAVDVDLPREGAASVRASAALAAETRSRFPPFAASVNKHFPKLAASLRQAGADSPLATMTIGWPEYVHLRESADVRSMKLVGFTDARAQSLDPDALVQARAGGTVEVVIELRGPHPFVAGRDRLPANASRAQLLAMRRVAQDILSLVPEATGVRDYSEVGAIALRLDEAALRRLYDAADPRILRVAPNRVVAGGGLATSTVTLNMAPSWASGMRGAGQTLVVLDSGVLKTHEFFKSGTATRVTGEGCWGSNTASRVSTCPSQDGNGDSPWNLAGAGAPSPLCPGTSSLTMCSHGTHIAGIAAGRASTQLAAGLQGIVPDASIIAAQVFSYDPAGLAEPGVYWTDLLAALQYLDQNSTATSNAYVVNLSLGSTDAPNTADCPAYYSSIHNVIQSLYAKNIPVVAAAMNNGYRFGIAFPACVPNVIKAGMTVNDAGGNTLHTLSNIVPDTLTGPMLLAPGAYITSAGIKSATAVLSMGGTSMAAPHIAGFYAAYKAAVPGATIANATAWIYGSGSVSAPQTFPGKGTYNFRRVRAP